MLDQILASKRRELEEAKTRLPFEVLCRRSPEADPPSLSQCIGTGSIDVIAEIKYRSPSRGDFPCAIPPEELSRIYSANGAAAISVITEKKFFAGDIGFLHLRQIPGDGKPPERRISFSSDSLLPRCRTATRPDFLRGRVGFGGPRRDP